MTKYSLREFEQLDRDDPMSPFRDKFFIPDKLTYLNGNSLGAMPSDAVERTREIVAREWGERLIRSWNESGWYHSPERIGNKIAQFIGADAGEVICTDATGINLFKVISMALQLQPERTEIIMEGSNFPTNNYVVQGLVNLLGNKHTIRFVEKDEIEDAITDRVAAVCLTHVHYKYSHILDMAAITAMAHKAGALAIWDLSHSAGAIPLDIKRADIDFAVGCTYKYLNGGPGAPAYVYVAKQHQGQVPQPLTGWWGHASPFEFGRDYRPAPDIQQMKSGTQGIVSMLIAEIGIDIMLEVDMQQAREKSISMSEKFIDLIDAKCKKHGIEVISPRKNTERGGHVALNHEQGFSIMRALIDRNVIGDYREPGCMRFTFSPLYNTYVDIHKAINTLEEILENEIWQQEDYRARHTVT